MVVLRTKDFIGINMPNTQQLRMEDMSVAYVRALCAVNGYSIGSVEHDNDGYDITIISYDISSMQKRGKLWI